MEGQNNTNGVREPRNAQNIAENSKTAAPKRRLSPAEEERRRRAAEIRRNKRETFFARLLFGAAIYFAFFLAIAGFVFSLYRGSANSAGAMSLVVAGSEGEELCTVSAKKADVNGVEYISAEALSFIYDFTLAGDMNTVTMHFHNLGQSLTLFRDSAVVEMNGEKIRLGSKIIFTDDYYIPLELIENYFNGAIIERDSEEECVTLSRNTEAQFYLRLQLPAPVSASSNQKG